MSSKYSLESQELLQWAQAEYPTNPYFPEHLIYRSPSGTMVRSKSEALIATLLFTNKIPFRYECALQLDDTTIYPDFTILHPITRQVYYWEHCGMMDSPVYAMKATKKLHLYTSHGFIPSIQLITTYESQTSPLDTTLFNTLIQYYFL